MIQNLAIGAAIEEKLITCAAVEISTGTILKDTLAESPLDNESQAFRIISIWSETIGETLSKVPADTVKGIGISIPGPFDYLKGISLIKGIPSYENLYGFNIGDAIRSSIEVPDDFEIRFIKNTFSYAVAEVMTGRAKGYDRVAYVHIDKDFDSVFLTGGIPVIDGHDLPEAGNLGNLSYNGNEAGTLFSEQGILKSFSRLSGTDMKEIAGIGTRFSNDGILQKVFDDFGGDLGNFLAIRLAGFNPGLVLFGGSISLYYEHFRKPLESSFKKADCKWSAAVSEKRAETAITTSALLYDDHFWNSISGILSKIK